MERRVRAPGRHGWSAGPWRIAAVLAVVAVASSALAACGPAGRSTRSGGHRGDRLIGPTDPSQVVDATLMLRIPGQDGLRSFLAGLNDPGSPRYHRFVSAAELGARFGLPRARIDRLEAQLRAGGLRVVDRYAQRTALRIEGTVGALNRTFGVGLSDFVDPQGRRYHAPIGAPQIPAGLRDAVADVVGLSSEHMVEPATVGTLALNDGQGLYPADLRRAYDVDPLWNAGIKGAGQSVAVASFATYRPEDLAAYDQRFGLTGPPVIRKVVERSTWLSGEVPLDLEMVRALAPEAQIYNYEGDPHLQNFYAVMNRIFSDGLATTVSLSWGLCEAYWGDLRGPLDRLLSTMAQDGITVFVASGDSGAYDCSERGTADDPRDPVNHKPAVDFPSSDPNVVAVGGTLLSLNAEGGYLQEGGWEDVLGRGGSGGGVSGVFPRPAWQAGPGVDGAGSNGNRQVPDVAASGASDSPVFVIGSDSNPDGSNAQGFQGGVWGTSAAAPFWAGAMALIKQYAAAQGAGPVPYANPVFYGIAAASGASPFHDMVLGRNLRYHATSGWDFVGGLGSPDVAALAQRVTLAVP
jgi:subtilase family serine protease